MLDRIAGLYRRACRALDAVEHPDLEAHGELIDRFIAADEAARRHAQPGDATPRPASAGWWTLPPDADHGPRGEQSRRHR